MSDETHECTLLRGKKYVEVIYNVVIETDCGIITKAYHNQDDALISYENAKEYQTTTHCELQTSVLTRVCTKIYHPKGDPKHD